MMSNEIIEKMGMSLCVLGVEYVSVFMAVVLDLVSGLRKARREGEVWRSRGLRRTVSKLTSYYLALFCLTAVDGIIVTSLTALSALGQSVAEPFPYLTTAGAVSLALIEVKSICENSPHPLDLLSTLRRLTAFLAKGIR